MDNLFPYQAQSILPDQQYKLDVDHIVAYPICKLSYKNMFYSKKQKICNKKIISLTENVALRTFNLQREKMFKSIKIFLQKKNYSQKKSAYYLNNWLSNQKLPCQKASTGNALLAYLTLQLKFQQAYNYACQIPKSLHISMITHLLKKFQQLQKMIQNSQYQQVKPQFFGRESFGLDMEQQYNGKYNQMQSRQNSKYLKIRQQNRMISRKLKFIVQFVNKIQKSKIDDPYLRLIVQFMGNKQDSLVYPNFLELLLSSKDLKLTDRLNFASLLLTQQNKQIFIKQFQNYASKMNQLQNLYIFLYLENEKIIGKIMQNYIDQYGDLETIANLALQNIELYPSLKKYSQSFVQATTSSFQYDQFYHSEQLLLWRSQSLNIPSYSINLYQDHFFHLLKNQEQKIIEPQSKNKTIICHICYQVCKTIMQGNFQCAKCRHGGHISHLISWFEKNQICPKVDCCCICN